MPKPHNAQSLVSPFAAARPSVVDPTAADIVLLESRDISMLGWAGQDAADHVALEAHPCVVDTVMVNGRFVKRDGRLLADLDALRRLIDSTTEHVAETIQSHGGFGVPDRSIPRPPRTAEG